MLAKELYLTRALLAAIRQATGLNPQARSGM